MAKAGLSAASGLQWKRNVWLASEKLCQCYSNQYRNESCGVMSISMAAYVISMKIVSKIISWKAESNTMAAEENETDRSENERRRIVMAERKQYQRNASKYQWRSKLINIVNIWKRNGGQRK